MADVFISYAAEDEGLARFVHDHLCAEGVTPFLASVSIQPGQPWSPKAILELKSSPWVIFLASRAACQSAFVQQELGMAMAGNKQIIPFIWEIEPDELPGWAGNLQAINLTNKTIQAAKADISRIAAGIKSKKVTGLLILGAIIGAILKFA